MGCYRQIAPSNHDNWSWAMANSWWWKKVPTIKKRCFKVGTSQVSGLPHPRANRSIIISDGKGRIEIQDAKRERQIVLVSETMCLLNVVSNPTYSRIAAIMKHQMEANLPIPQDCHLQLEAANYYKKIQKSIWVCADMNEKINGLAFSQWTKIWSGAFTWQITIQ